MPPDVVQAALQDTALAAGSFLLAYGAVMDQVGNAVLCVVGCWLFTMLVELTYGD